MLLVPLCLGLTFRMGTCEAQPKLWPVICSASSDSMKHNSSQQFGPCTDLPLDMPLLKFVGSHSDVV